MDQQAVQHGSASLSSYFEELHEDYLRVERRTDSSTARVYRVAGRILRVEYGDSALAAALGAAFEDRQVDDRLSPDLILCAWRGARTSPWMTALREHVSVTRAPRTASRIRPRCHFSDGARIQGVWNPASDIAGLIDRTRRLALWRVPEGCELPVSERGGPFRAILQWWLEEHGWQIVHGGAVGTTDGAVLLVGKGGSGKSTSCMACLDAGCLYLGDDSVLIEPTPSPTVDILYGTCTLHFADASRFPSCAQAIVNTRATRHEKALIAVSRLIPDRLVTRLPLRAILVPKVTSHSGASLRKLSPSATFAALAPTSMFNLPGVGHRAFSILAVLCRRVPGFALDVGTDPRSIPRVIVELVGLQVRSAELKV